MARAAARLTRPRPDPARKARLALADGAATTIYVAEYDLRRTEVRVALVRGRQLAPWCAARGAQDALVGGFSPRPAGEPLGELRTRGLLRRHVPFDEPWGQVRACVSVSGQ